MKIVNFYNRNTTHVVFKNGLQSTYNKARKWKIPIVTIHWFEACKKNKTLVDPRAFIVPNIKEYEDPGWKPEVKILK